MSKHTPAPWKTIINPINLDLEVWNGKDCICVVDGDDKANAKLIAAAPELLEALQMLSEWNDKYPPNKVYSYDRAKVIETALTEIVEKAKEAIKKAT